VFGNVTRDVDNLKGVTYIIAEPCIDLKDRSCVDVCPVDCIHEFDRILIIDPEECIDCGACEPECPVEAIFPEDALLVEWTPFVRINYAYDDAAVINNLVEQWRGGDEGTSGVREPRNPSPDAPGDDDELDLPA
jgi:ferredoxin